MLRRDERGYALTPSSFLLWVEATESGNLALILDLPVHRPDSRLAVELLFTFAPLRYALIQELQGAMQRG